MQIADQLETDLFYRQTNVLHAPVETTHGREHSSEQFYIMCKMIKRDSTHAVQLKSVLFV